jgi:hypothetical protein
MKLYAQYTSWDNPKVADRPLVIGYVSPDFFTHSVSYFVEAPLAHHDYSNCKVVVYSGVVKVEIICSLLAILDFVHTMAINLFRLPCLIWNHNIWKINMQNDHLTKTRAVIQWLTG